MDEEAIETSLPPVGDQLRAARKKKKLSLEDIAAQTRIPLRHLESIEASDWAHLPAPTYSVGFAKSYAAVVDLDRTLIGDQLRAEMGDPRSVPVTPPEVFEPADPARAMPKALVIGAIIALVALVLVMSWLNRRSLGDSGAAPAGTVAADPVIARPATTVPAPSPIAQGPVVLSAVEALWMTVYDKDGTSYFSGMLTPGSDFTVPATATSPMVKTAKPEGLKIMVGSAVAPAIGPAGQLIGDVSLLPADLLGTRASAPPPAATSASPTG
ncbi:MAG: RodZ domain-containing protein [Sphingomicrobium sp.]